ncbi:hypothetical protein CY34DRAFT_806326 [Suillus luteus UH-Slu-Lm8-n1]|uniref:Uncharacterized protein n=1 Tax=Suillus luteus UH-Slu-Lm8-n1 TaxID=930992 RepID=A0A0D0B409_9AGAM|nr:hypothetical protein CY34DRAFT_806326 [Suillus luteus UH-Slu-Lm8-n1]
MSSYSVAFSNAHRGVLAVDNIPSTSALALWINRCGGGPTESAQWLLLSWRAQISTFFSIEVFPHQKDTRGDGTTSSGVVSATYTLVILCALRKIKEAASRCNVAYGVVPITILVAHM